MIVVCARHSTVHQSISDSGVRHATARVSRLEAQSHWLEAMTELRHALAVGLLPIDAHHLHWLGRLHQRLGSIDLARRAYIKALQFDSQRPATYNNLALLELDRLDGNQAESWLLKGLDIPNLTDEQADLLHATACEVYLFRLRPAEALHYVQRQLQRCVTVMALANQAVCFHKLGEFQQAVASQSQAISLQLQQQCPFLADLPLPQLVSRPLKDPAQSAQLQLQLMNLGIFRLLCQADDPQGLQLLLAGTANGTAYWFDQRRSSTRWNGQQVDELILWDDQGFGDTIQNLSWIDEAAARTRRLRLWLRPSLFALVMQRCHLPSHVTLEAMAPDAEPWGQSIPQLGLFFLPMVLGLWPRQSEASRTPWLQRRVIHASNTPRRMGLVWSAGRHRAPQPERSARVRDVPFEQLWAHARHWQEQHYLELVSLQLEDHDSPAVPRQHTVGLLRQGLHSSDWLSTAECLEQLDLLVSVDTSVAHLAGALGVPCVLLLSAPADWRWGQVGTTTSLYASFRLARCQARNAWHTALKQADQQVAAILRAE